MTYTYSVLFKHVGHIELQTSKCVCFDLLHCFRLASNKKIQAELKEEMANLKREKDAALREIGVLKEKLSLHDFRVRSLQDTLESDDNQPQVRTTAA